jgi:rod shape-determining protein MreC
VVEQIQNEEEVGVGEWFYTSGEDRIFPRGFPVGTVISAQPGNGMKDVRLNLSGAPGGAEEVLVVLDGVHQPIPTGAVPEEKMAPPLPAPPPDDKQTTGVQSGSGQTEADKTLQKYEQLGKEEDHVYGAIYSNMPNFNVKPAPKPPAAPPGATNTSNTAPLGSAPVLGAPVTHQTATPNTAAKPPAAKTATATATHATSTRPKAVLPLGSPHRAGTTAPASSTKRSTNQKPTASTQPQ